MLMYSVQQQARVDLRVCSAVVLLLLVLTISMLACTDHQHAGSSGHSTSPFDDIVFVHAGDVDSHALTASIPNNTKQITATVAWRAMFKIDSTC